MRRAAPLLFGCAAAFFGCGGPPPCEVDPSDVDAARAAATAAEARLEAAIAEHDRLGDELEAAETRRAEMEAEKAAAEAKLQELKRRSGRAGAGSK